MNRRQFVKSAVAALGTVAARKSLSTADFKVALDEPKSKIGYIKDSAPAFQVPAYRGQSYADTVPDTLDVAERAKLAVHGLTSITDPAYDYEIYWSCNFFQNPPVMKHDFNDWVQNQEGLMEALPLLRNATGDESKPEVDRAWMESTLRSVGPDGLIYVPLNGRPWGGSTPMGSIRCGKRMDRNPTSTISGSRRRRMHPRANESSAQ